MKNPDEAMKKPLHIMQGLFHGCPIEVRNGHPF
jgi:hypothetical protein